MGLVISRPTVATRRHALIAGTGRAGTTFLVKFLEACGLQTGQAEWYERARAGLEHRIDPADATQPYVLKDPMLGSYCERLDLTAITIDALIVPVRELAEAAESRVLQERLRLAESSEVDQAGAEVTAWTPGGVFASLTVVDQERLLAVGFHRLLRWATVNDLPLFLLDFPRIVEDCEYLFDALAPWLEQHCDADRAREAFDATAQTSAIRVHTPSNGYAAHGLDRVALVERIAELSSALQTAQERLDDGAHRSSNGAAATSSGQEAETAERHGEWLENGLFRVDETEFAVSADAEVYMHVDSTEKRFVLAKTPAMVDRLAGMVAELAPKRIVELGIFKGGSAALLAALAKPTKLTAVELGREPVPALERWLDAFGLHDVVRAHYGVDQGDTAAVGALLAEDHGAQPLDLVVDDASHLYRETRASFELLFARLRPGGRYVIEDWGWAHFPEPVWQEAGGFFHDRPALTNLVVEILMLAATDAELVADIQVLRDTVTVTRGPAQLDRPLRLERYYRNRGLPFRPIM